MTCIDTPRAWAKSVLACLLAPVLSLAAVAGEVPAAPAQAPQPWTFQDALAELKLNRQDPYLQYVAYRLAADDQRTDVDKAIFGSSFFAGMRGGGRDADLFGVFTGALAVQETLQLDTLRQAGPAGKKGGKKVPLKALEGPKVPSHPWQTMLGARKPEVGALARCVPEDQWFVVFGSLSRMLDALDTGKQWSAELHSQGAKEASSQDRGERLKAQLALETNPLVRPFYDLAVEEVALTGSDLYLREGSDVTILFKIRNETLFRARVDGFFDAFAKRHPGAARTKGEYQGVAYECLQTDDGVLRACAGYPGKDIHVRSNSVAAFKRTVDAILGHDAQNQPVVRLGWTDEYRYARVLMPRGANEEHGFAYLSDAFVRRQVGARVKLAERRRLLCFNHLQMIRHACLLHRTQTGRAPQAAQDLLDSKALPPGFFKDPLACPAGGTYELSADGTGARCTVHGTTEFLTPICELELDSVSEAEAEAYRNFVEEYSRYWRQYFDPIGVRLKTEPQGCRIETVILPLIDNSIYTNLKRMIGGEPKPPAGLPVLKREILGMELNYDRAAAGGEVDRTFADFLLVMMMEEVRLEPGEIKASLRGLVERGLSGTLGFHVLDSDPSISVNLSEALGEMMTGRGGERLAAAFLGIGFVSPVYVSAKVSDAVIVDRFLEQTDALIAQAAQKPRMGGWFGLEMDFYKYKLKDGTTARVQSFSVGPVRWRQYYARIGGGLYVATRRDVLDELVVAHAAEKANAADGAAGEAVAPAHARLALRPGQWNRILPDLFQGWTENNREACLANLGPLSAVARAHAVPEGEAGESLLLAEAERTFGQRRFCPDGGHYAWAAEEKRVRCSVHGSRADPAQPPMEADPARLQAWRKTFGETRVSFRFTEEGLRAILEIRRE